MKLGNKELIILNDVFKNSKIIKSFDLENDKISYKDIKQNQIKEKLNPEEKVRAFLLTKLVNMGYKPEYIEIEKEYTAGRPKVIKPRIDIIVKDKNNNVFLFIELKTPEEYEKDKDEIIEKQLFNLAALEKTEGHKVKYLMLYTYEITENEIRDKCIIIDYEKFSLFTEWKEIRDYADTIPEHYGLAKKPPFIKGSEKDLEKTFTPQQINSLQFNLHNVLWGGGGTDDNDVFASLVNIILAKIQDESSTKDGAEYKFQIFSNYTEKNKDELHEDNQIIFERINKLYREALKEKLNIIDENKLKKSYVIDENKFSLSKLKYTIQELERFSFIDAKNSLSGKDILGDFFEGIIREGFKQTKGQFFTPINIVKFMLYALQVDKLAIKRINEDKEIPYMIDPSAGSGTFLIEYMKFITENIKYRFKEKLDKSRDIEEKFELWFKPDHRENKWAEKYIYGIEINFNLGTATKVNMILHGDGSTNIFVKDGLLPFNFYTKTTAPNTLNSFSEDKSYKKDTNKQFDIIISNPPFSVTLDKETKERIKDSFIFSAENSENLFIERWYQLLRENGRLAVVLPENIFDTTENKYIRLFLYKFFKIKAIISLPQLTFEPYTSTKTSLLFAQKKTETELQEWDKLWAQYSNEYNNLKTRIENLINVYLDNKNRNKLPSIKDLTEQEEKEILVKFLRTYFDKNDENLKVQEIVKKYQDELKEICKLDKQTIDVFGYVNTW